MSELINVLNVENKPYSSNCYEIQIGYHLAIHTVVYANEEQEAIDIIIDHYEHSKDHKGFWFNEGDYDNETEEEIQQIKEGLIYGGNHCLYMNFGYEELHIKSIDFESDIYIDVKDQ